MNTLRCLVACVVGLLFVVPIGVAPRASAQDLNAPVEEFRAEMSSYMTELEAVLRQFAKIPAVSSQFDKNGLDPVTALRNAKAGLAELSFDDLVKMRAAYARVPGWRDAPSVISGIAQRVANGAANTNPGVANKGGISINVITPDACPEIDATPSFADIAITEGFQIASDAVMEGFPTDGLTILARLAPVAIRAGLKAAVLAEVTLRSQYDDCHSLSATDVQDIVDGATTQIINNDNSNTTSIVNNDNSNTMSLTSSISAAQTAITTAISTAQTAIINNSNANTLTIINNDNANADLQLRRLIEADLAEADNATPVALYVTPSSRGGYSDVVTTIVTDTIADVQALGGSVVNAQAFLAQANAAKAAGNYRTAYSLYRKAYKSAANSLG
jgi:hypothetical protein